ncbi:MAG TPA: hypothetical protein ACFYEM_00735 [Candidatus Hypogeohydataceae bacterium YC40]
MLRTRFEDSNRNDGLWSTSNLLNPGLKLAAAKYTQAVGTDLSVCPMRNLVAGGFSLRKSEM